MLESYPALSDTGCLDPETHILSWTGVANASGYKVRIYDAAGTTFVTDSGGSLLTATSCDLSGNALLEPGAYYQCRVDAQYLDYYTGWPAEITRGVGGFEY